MNIIYKLKLWICLLGLLLSPTFLHSCEKTEQVPLTGIAFYYDTLSYKQQLLYDVIIAGVSELSEQTDAVSFVFSQEEWRQVINAVLYDNPQLFYLDTASSSLSITGKKSIAELVYFIDVSDITAIVEKFENKIAEIADLLNLKSQSIDPVDKEIAIHDYIVLNVTNKRINEADSLMADTAYGVLVENTAGSPGYAAAFKILCGEAGILCEIIAGDTQNTAHLWNMVKVGEGYAYVDTVWNDPDTDIVPDMVFHGYFNISYDKINRDHNFALPDIYPKNGEVKNYYTYKDLYAADSDTLYNIAFREITAALEEERVLIELCADITDDEFNSVIRQVISDINTANGTDVIDRTFRRFNASKTNNACVIMLYLSDWVVF